MRLRIFYFYLEKRVLFYTIEECKHSVYIPKLEKSLKTGTGKDLLLLLLLLKGEELLLLLLSEL
jgi:hypothetical protein